MSAQRPPQHPPPNEERFPPLPSEAAARAKDSARQSAMGKRSRPARQPRPARDRSRDPLYNLLSVIFALGTILLLGIGTFLWTNYNSPLNPLAPPTPLPNVVTATYTSTVTHTPSPTLTPSHTYTPSPIPSITPSLTFTPVFLEGFSTPQGTPLAPDAPTAFRYSLQGGVILYLTNPDARGGCRWSSIAGSVADAAGVAVNGYSVRIVGASVDERATTGSAPGFGPGGFEVQLGRIAQDASYVAQLFDATGAPVSTVFTVTTRAECTYTIAALRFIEVAP